MRRSSSSLTSTSTTGIAGSPRASASSTRAWPSRIRPVRTLRITRWTQPTSPSMPLMAARWAGGWRRQFSGWATSSTGGSWLSPTIRFRHGCAARSARGAAGRSAERREVGLEVGLALTANRPSSDLSAPWAWASGTPTSGALDRSASDAGANKIAPRSASDAG